MNIFVTRTLPSSVIARLESAGNVDVYVGDGVDPRDELHQRGRRQARVGDAC